MINFSNVPVSTAIKNLARMAQLNFLFDPKLFAPPGGSNKNGMREASLTLTWTNISAADALARVLRENNLIMVRDKFSTVALISGTNHVANVVDASLLVSTNPVAQVANGVIPRFRFSCVPMDVALKQLIEIDHLDVVLDPKVSDYVDPDDQTANQFHSAPMVSLVWENLTAKQALVALCVAYDLAIIKETASGVVIIKPRN